MESQTPNQGPALTLAEAQAQVASKTAPKVTKESIEAAINQVSYLHHDTLTVCIINMKNGFMQIGKAAPASAANFDPAIGERYAYEDAFRGLWQLEGYSLCQKLFDNRAAKVAESPGEGQNGQATP